ncbi:MAG: Mrp/NBP35 family ATP-binding protein [Candidatus Izemoplasmatales bacterium]
MNEECNGDCASCAEECEDRKEPVNLKAEPNPTSRVKRMIAIVSGKGGVGKSYVTSLLAVAAKRSGRKVGILDADVTGPSIPRMFGIRERATDNEFGLVPVPTKTGIATMSVNLLLERETDPVVWRGPLIAKMVTQFWTDVAWGDLDLLFVDMPPGTGDVALTVFQSLPVDGIVVVTSPQELVSMIVAKAVKMADLLHVPVLAVVENMSYFKCPECGAEHAVFGRSAVEKVAREYGVRHAVRLPIEPTVARLCDAGRIEFADISVIKPLVDVIDPKEE